MLSSVYARNRFIFQSLIVCLLSNLKLCAIWHDIFEVPIVFIMSHFLNYSPHYIYEALCNLKIRFLAKKWFKLCYDNRNTISCPDGRAMMCPLWEPWKKWPRYIESAFYDCSLCHCLFLSHRGAWLSLQHWYGYMDELPMSCLKNTLPQISPELIQMLINNYGQHKLYGQYIWNGVGPFRWVLLIILWLLLSLIGQFDLWWISLIAQFMGPTWGPHGVGRTMVAPMLATWTLLSGMLMACINNCNWHHSGPIQYAHKYTNNVCFL